MFLHRKNVLECAYPLRGMAKKLINHSFQFRLHFGKLCTESVSLGKIEKAGAVVDLCLDIFTLETESNIGIAYMCA